MALKIAKELTVETTLSGQYISLSIHTPTVGGETEESKFVDEYIKLYEHCEAFSMKQHLAEMEVVKKKLQEIANENFDAKEQAILHGTLGKVVYSPNAEVVEVDAPYILLSHLASKFGTEVAYKTIKFSITALRQLLSSSELEEFVKKVPGARSLKTVLPD